MRKIIMLAGIAALAATTPALAKDHGRHGNNHRDHNRWSQNYYSNHACPPGLAKKHNGCMPPGQARKLYRVGERWRYQGTTWRYDQVPYSWRNQYSLNPYDRYYYNNGYLYSVDPKTQLIRSVIEAIIR